MRFDVIHDKGSKSHTWNLTTNSGDIIASSSMSYHSLEEIEAAIKEFKLWVNQAHTKVIVREPVKDWKQQAKEQLKKTPWQKTT